ncbi:MAG TPA: hypothetical protein VMV56_11380 [Williamwhitmania sp.]|nr:hypothetical protein [Williamwhitmania sp.]
MKTTVKQAVSTDGTRIFYPICLVDKIVVLNNGEVVEQRINQELMAISNGLHAIIASCNIRGKLINSLIFRHNQFNLLDFCGLVP